jgi:hypothetical protein
MSWIPFYADVVDIAGILAYLNKDDATAFIVTDGTKRWRAAARLPSLPDGRYTLWICLAGPLPLLRPRPQTNLIVDDPWSGWDELRTGANPKEAYFGSSPTVVAWLHVRTHGRESPGSIGLSSFGWVGNKYSRIGNPAPPAALDWWKKLGRNLKRRAIRIPRCGPLDGPKPEIWAQPSALAKFHDGTPRDRNP